MTSQDNSKFRDFFDDVKPIRLKEPLAETLGAFTAEGIELDYSFIDTVKAAGHACPSVTGAYLCVQEALDHLYDRETPVRGDIAVTIHGKPDEGALGVMAQVFTYLTGAATETGFKGLGPRFKRQGLLKFDPQKIEEQAVCFTFARSDTGRSVTVRFYPWLIPFPSDKASLLAGFMEKVVAGAADEETRKSFQALWMEKIRAMIIERKDIGTWLRVQ